MSDFSMWGPTESGSRVWEQDQIANFGRVAQGLNLAASARLHGAQADAAVQEAETKRAVAARLSAMGQGQGGSEPADSSPMALVKQIELAAKAHSDAGDYEAASKLSHQAAQTRASLTSAGANQALMLQRQAKQAHDQLNVFGSAIDGVTDQASFDRANAVYEQVFQAPSPWRGQQYSPELVSTISRAALTKKDQLRIALAERNLERQEANTESAIDFRKFRETMLEAQLELARTREVRLRKNGDADNARADRAEDRKDRKENAPPKPKPGADKPVASPTNAESVQAGKLVAADFPDLPAGEVKAAAYDIASRAKGLRKANPALDAAEALRQAYSEAKAGGSFETLEANYNPWGKDGSFNPKDVRLKPATKYAPKPRAGGSTPVALPADRKLTPGTTYQTARGPAVWDGKVFTPVKEGGNAQ